jgi:hypothetical protein
MVVSAGKDVLTDRIAVVYATSTGGVKVATSTNSGLTFTNTPLYQDGGGGQTNGAFPTIAAPGGSRLVAAWSDQRNDGLHVRFSSSGDWGMTWTRPKELVTAGTGLYPWIDARGGKIAVSMFHTSATAAPEKVPAESAWYESYLESSDGGKTWSRLVAVDPTPVKTGPICTDGVECGSDRELGDFQSLVLDGAGRAHLTYARSVDGTADTQIRYVRQVA